MGGGFSAGNLVIGGERGGGVREGVYPLLPGVRGLGPGENFSDCRCIFVSFSALFSFYREDRSHNNALNPRKQPDNTVTCCSTHSAKRGN
jgi:hypothetical protein